MTVSVAYRRRTISARASAERR